MIKRILKVSSITLLIFLIFYIGIDLLIYTDEERILDVLSDCKKAIEEENSSLASNCLSKSYKDDYGLSKENLLKLGEGVFTKFDDFKVIIDKKEISIDKDTGILKISFKILITYNGQRAFLFGELNHSATVTLIFGKDAENERGWRITGMKDLKPKWHMEALKK
jgi:hypothetical protein